MDKEDVVYINNRILLSHKKNEVLPFAITWMDLEDITLNKVSQTKKNKYCMFPLTCRILKIKQMHEYNKTEIDSLIQRTN